MTGTTVRAGGAELHVRRTGRGTPLLLLHGVTDSGACWSRVAADLADHRVVAPDARGHGRSSRIVAGAGGEDRVADAAEVIRATADGPVAVWGHSMGAATAAALAAAHPGLVSRVVLEDPPFTEDDADDRPGLDEVRSGIGRMLADVRSAAPADRLRVAQEANPDWDAAELPGWVESKLQFDDRVLDEPVAGGDWRETVRRIEAPVLLVTGDPDRGAIVTPAVAAELAALHPGTTVRRFAGAGHNVHREAYGEVLAAVREFLGSGN